MTYGDDGTRAVGAPRQTRDKRVILVGGSFTQGWALDDRDTFGWMLQESYPSRQFLNLAAGGYGTLQSLLVLEHWLAKLKGRASHVVYGFIRWHEHRNVADSRQLRILAAVDTAFSRTPAQPAQQAGLRLPFCTLDANGALSRKRMPLPANWPLSDRSALVYRLQVAALELRHPSDDEMARRVTQKLLVEMNELCKAHGARLIVAALRVPDEVLADYRPVFTRNDIAVCEANLPDDKKPEWRVPWDGHPDARANAFWASKIKPFLRDE